MTTFRTKRTMEFADTDMGGIVHFSRFFVFMETAEHAFLRANGSNGWDDRNGAVAGWPRVRASCEYSIPARYGDTLDIEVRVTRKGRTSLAYAITFRRDDEIIARGEMVTVHCTWTGAGKITSTPLPEGLAESDLQ